MMVEPPSGNGSTTSTSPNVYFLSTYVFYITSTFDYYVTVLFLAALPLVANSLNCSPKLRKDDESVIKIICFFNVISLSEAIFQLVNGGSRRVFPSG